MSLARIERESEQAGTPPHALLAAAFRSFDHADVRWCVLRDEADLASPVSDVDVLLARPDRKRAGRLLLAAGFVALPAWGHWPHRFFLGRGDRAGAWLKIDAVTELVFGAERLTPQPDLAQACLRRRRRRGGLAVLHPADAFWLLLLHCLLDKRNVPERHTRTLVQLTDAAGAGGPVGAAVAAAAPAGWDVEHITAAVKAERWEQLTPLARGLSEAWRRSPLSRLRPPVDKALRRLRRLGLPPRRGLTVALLAPDGAGKTTVAAALTASLPVPARVIYMGLYSRERPAARRRVPPGVGLALRVTTQWWRYGIGRWHRFRGEIVLFDRYCYDALATGTDDLTRLRRLRRVVLGRTCPGPDLVVVLDAPGPVLHERTGEHDLDVLERRRQSYLALARDQARWIVVNAAQERRDVQRDVERAVWSAYAARARDGIS